jgi:hypothetical protein
MRKEMKLTIDPETSVEVIDWGGNFYRVNKYDFQAMALLDEAVRRGAEFLDSRDLLWFTKIDIDKLNIASGETCICGQLFAKKLEQNFGGLYHPYHGFDYAIRYVFLQDGELPVENQIWDHEDWVESQGVASYLGFNLPQEVLNSEEYSDDDPEWINSPFHNAEFMYQMTRQYEYLAISWITQIEKRIANTGGLK